MTPAAAGWRPGDTVVQRFVRPDGTVGAHHPLTVVADDGRRLLGWLPAGTPVVTTRLPDGRDIRDVALAERFRLGRVRARGSWRGQSTLRLIPEDEWSSVWWFFDPAGAFLGWYVNLEIPVGRRAVDPGPAADAAAGIVDRIDGVLDLLVAPDRGWRWKDVDEADAAVEAGRLAAGDLARLRAEGERMAALAEAGEFPFDGSWTGYAADPAAPPRLPAWAEQQIEDQAERR